MVSSSVSVSIVAAPHHSILLHNYMCIVPHHNGVVQCTDRQKFSIKIPIYFGNSSFCWCFLKHILLVPEDESFEEQWRPTLHFAATVGYFKISSHKTVSWSLEIILPMWCQSWGDVVHTKIQQTKILVTCQRFGDWFLFGLVWQYSSHHKTYNKFKVIATYLQQ